MAKFQDLKFNDKVVPIEKVINLIRKRKITRAEITFNFDGAGQMFYNILGEADEEFFSKGFDLESKLD